MEYDAKAIVANRKTALEYCLPSTTEKDGGTQILECHSPLLNVMEQYPIVGRFEQEMFEAVLGTRVRREVNRNSGLYECAFYFSA